MQYFDLSSDMRIPGRWILADPIDEHGQELDPWQFDEGRLLELHGLPRLPLAHPGRALDFSFTTLGIPIVSSRVGSVLDRLGLQRQVQLLPATVDGEAASFFILNVLPIIRCIDDARCEEVRYWRPEDGNPERVGEYHIVRGLRIDPSRVENGVHIFRPWGWRAGVILVSERLKQALEQDGVTGTKLTPV